MKEHRVLFSALELFAALGTAVLTAGSALADNPCTDSQRFGFNSPGPLHIPNCELQTQPTLTFGGDHSGGYAFFCSGDSPYFWGYSANYYRSYTWDNSCFTVSENPFFESGTDGKFDATFTNWCTEQEPVTVILACSSTPQPENPSRGE
jgi:hypothetical protein